MVLLKEQFLVYWGFLTIKIREIKKSGVIWYKKVLCKLFHFCAISGNI